MISTQFHVKPITNISRNKFGHVIREYNER